MICANEPEATRHPLYADAKVGDAKAAEGLILDVLPVCLIAHLNH